MVQGDASKRGIEGDWPVPLISRICYSGPNEALQGEEARGTSGKLYFPLMSRTKLEFSAIQSTYCLHFRKAPFVLASCSS